MVTPMTQGATPVLVADDNLVIRRLVSARLRNAGYRVAEAIDGAAALAEFEREPVPVVVTDLNMPRLDGLSLLAALRRRDDPPEVILLTGTRARDVEAAVLLLADSGLSGAQAVARRIVDVVARDPLRAGHLAAVVTCSVGVSELRTSDDARGVELVGRADAALYTAKRAGRNRFVAFTDAANGPGLPPAADGTSAGMQVGPC